ncbi:hypothetical protein GCM10022205_10750 [Spinactinospora alkalitolerans]
MTKYTRGACRGSVAPLRPAPTGPDADTEGEAEAARIPRFPRSPGAAAALRCDRHTRSAPSPGRERRAAPALPETHGGPLGRPRDPPVTWRTRRDYTSGS